MYEYVYTYEEVLIHLHIILWSRDSHLPGVHWLVRLDHVGRHKAPSLSTSLVRDPISRLHFRSSGKYFTDESPCNSFLTHSHPVCEYLTQLEQQLSILVGDNYNSTCLQADLRISEKNFSNVSFAKQKFCFPPPHSTGKEKSVEYCALLPMS